jgi:hypothetical protein
VVLLHPTTTTATEVTEIILIVRTDVQVIMDFQLKMATLNSLDIITPAREIATAIRAAMVTTEAISMAEQVSPMAEDPTTEDSLLARASVMADSTTAEVFLMADSAMVEASLLSAMMENLTILCSMAAMPREIKDKDIMVVVDKLLEWEMV